MDLDAVIHLDLFVLVRDDERLIQRERDHEHGEQQHCADLDRLRALVGPKLHYPSFRRPGVKVCVSALLLVFFDDLGIAHRRLQAV
ncbi:hypothetical protein [Halorhabdus tiamatea]|uniref:hypothetical protein n=1 Tax=Halorhabdus tiamatea TaxID=430914 RepID=UPI0011D1D9A3|nr:hypothetical protein [Halorhabdus tiamatea]